MVKKELTLERFASILKQYNDAAPNAEVLTEDDYFILYNLKVLPGWIKYVEGRGKKVSHRLKIKILKDLLTSKSGV